MINKNPLLIVITSNRNYGWIVPLFLAANSSWADYIIITDQMSTDGSREMYAKYPNVIVIDDKDMNFKENTRARVAFERGREIAEGRDTIYFALDIDEILPANWRETRDGKQILKSKCGDMFSLRWANIQSDNKTYIEGDWQYKIFHDSGIEWQYCKYELHTPHLPYSSYGVEPTKIMDFPNLHFGYYNIKWRLYNSKYYKMLDVSQKRSKSVVSINRGFYNPNTNNLLFRYIQFEWLDFDFDVFNVINLNVKPQGAFLIKDLIKQEGIDKFKGIDIWDEEFCTELQLKDPRTILWKLFHYYIRKTQSYRFSIFIRIVDKVLKYVI